MDGLSTKTRSRRSFPSLETLHITPLTHEPLGQSPIIDEEDESIDRRRSYLHSRSLPQTPSILSRSSSRSNSRSRAGGHRSTKSSLALTSLDDGSLLPRTPGGTARKPKSAFASGRQTPARVRIANGESTEFLLRTASLLVENASESKGQGWISKRNSSTSLTNYEIPESAYPADDEFSGQWSARGSRRQSRRNSVSVSAGTPGSRWVSRRGSRGAMGPKTPVEGEIREGYFEDMELEFEGEDGWEDEEVEETIDESELKRLLRRRVGGLFEDIFGGWFDFRGEDDEGSDNDEPPDGPDDEKTPGVTTQRAQERKQRFAGVTKEDLIDVQPPAAKGSPIGDARWLLGLARSVLI